MQQLVAILLVALFLLPNPALCGTGSKEATYVGGTLPIKELTEGKSFTENERVFVFEYKNGKEHPRWEIPYAKIDSLEYGQKAGRRGGSVVLSPLVLFSKKRKHFLTIGYIDAAGKQQAAVFELGKDIIRTTLAILEARTGKKIEYQDDEARKSGRGN